MTVVHNTAKGITLTGNDLLNQTLTYSITTSPAHGALSGFNSATGAVTYTPATGYQGADSFTFTVSNGINTSAAATVTLTVGAGTPTANNQTVSVPHNTATPITLTGSDPNTPTLPLTFSIATSPAHGALTGFNSATGAVTYTPFTGYHGTDLFTFTVNNGTNTSTAATVTLIVGVGTPTANSQSVSVPHDTAKAITLTGSDDDIPLLTLTYSIATSPAHGTLSGFNSATGAVTYTPTTGSSGSDSFTFTVSNGTNTSTAAMVSITVSPASPATLSGISALWGTLGSVPLVDSGSSSALLLPTGRTNDLPWLNIKALNITLSVATTLSAGDVSVIGITGGNYGPVTISGSGTNYTITLSKPVAAADRLTLTIGSATIATYTRELDILPGDVNDDGAVNTTDGVLILGNTTPAHAYNVFRDMNGDGSVTTTDFTLYRPYIGTTLPNLPPQLAAGGEGPGGVPLLSQAELAPVLAAAINAWADAGLSASDVALLHAVTVQITTLPTGYLGGTALGSTTVALSADAAGWGWFIDPTPGPDAAFAQPAAATEWLAAPSSPASGHEDLLKVVMHELGHVLGLGDLNPATSPTDLMAETLATGVRRLPSLLDVTAVSAAPAGTTLAGLALTRIVAPAGPGIFDARPAQTLASVSVVAALLSPPAQFATVPGAGGTAPLPTAAPTAGTAAPGSPAGTPDRPDPLPVTMNLGGHKSGTKHAPWTDDLGDDLAGGAV